MDDSGIKSSEFSIEKFRANFPFLQLELLVIIIRLINPGLVRALGLSG